MLQSRDGCWHRLSSLDLYFKPARRQPLHYEPELPGLPGDISIYINKLEFVCKYLSNISQLTLPSWHYICPLPTPPGCLAAVSSLPWHCHPPHLAVAAGAAALGHTLDLPGQGLVHQVRQGLLTEQVGPQLHTGKVFQQGKRNRKCCSATIITKITTLPCHSQ